MGDVPSFEDALLAGRAALSRGAWTEARDLFHAALEACEAPEALEGLSWALWWLEDVTGCLDARERAYQRYRDAGDRQGAARMALWLGDDHVEFAGASAVADGWFRRASRILAELEPCPEHGWLAVFEAHAALGRLELEAAGRLARRAREHGRDLGSVDLEMFGLATEGVARIARGEIAEGLGALDEAAAAALGGEYESLAPAAWTCCLIMSTCERVRDYPRAAQWCQQIERFSERMGARFLTGVCRAHYGVIRAWQGSWDDAERELTAAVDGLSANRPSWRPEALVRLGHLRRRQGRDREAETLFEQAPEHPLALIGMGALALDRGDPAAARDVLERARRLCAPEDRAGRADAVELLVAAYLALGDVASASEAVDELGSIAAVVGTQALQAAARTCEGSLAAAQGDLPTACDRLEDAAALFLRSGTPVEAARTRIELAHALLALSRAEAAERQARLALAHIDGIGAEAERRAADAVLARVAADRGSGPGDILTARQVEVLRLVAEGLSDQRIAERLVLSPHTVHRHVANIYTRLGCSSRPAAVAEASRRGLL